MDRQTEKNGLDTRERNFGSLVESEATGFLVFSHTHFMGYFMLG